jgi:hypothetical protein
MSKRVVVEVQEDVHREIRKIAVMNDLKIYQLVNAMLRDCLDDEDRVKAVLKQLI